MVTPHVAVRAFLAVSLSVGIAGAQPRPAPSTRSPMDEARACLHNNPRDLAAGNLCVVLALSGRATPQPEIALLAAIHGRLRQGGDATRMMRIYLRRFPDGSSAPSFRQYLEMNAR